MRPALSHSCAALALFASLHGIATAQANPLLGCWKGETVTQFLADGRHETQQSAGGLEYTSGEIISRSLSPRPPSEIRYRYFIVRPGVYTATMMSHSHRPDLIDSYRDYEYKVEDDRLYITTNPQTTQPAPPTAAVRVESTSRSVPCSELRPPTDDRA